MATSNRIRALNRLPFDFQDGLKVGGVDVTALNQTFTPAGAGLVGFTPVGNLSAGNVQAALAELESEKVGFARLDDTDGSSLVGYDGGTVQDVMDSAKPMADYTALRAYIGSAIQVRITDPGIAGFFYYDAADTTSADNGGTVILDARGQRWKRIFVGALSVTWFGAKGDGVADDTVAINATISAAGMRRDVHFPAPSSFYVITSKLTQLTGQRWFGEAGRRVTVIKKMANMAEMVETGDTGAIQNIMFDANGASFTGRGIYVGPGNDIKLRTVRVIDSEGVSLQFADESGAGCCIDDFYGTTTNPTVVPALKLGSSATTAFPKFFSGLWLSGGLVDLTAGNAGRDCSFTNFFIRNFVTSEVTGRTYISNGRVASLTDTTTLKGNELVISNVAFSGPVVLNGARSYRLANNIYHAGISEINSVSGSGNQYTTRLTGYTPTWSQGSGAQPSIGNGTLQGWFAKNGDTCTVTVQLTFGSTTDPGNDATGYLFSLPLRASTSLNQRIIGADILDASPAAQYLPFVTIAGDAMIFKLSTTQDVRATFPVTWGAGDIIRAQFTYYTA